MDRAKKFFRLAPGREVRLRYAYYVKCERVVTDEKTGEIVEVHCSYDPETLNSLPPDGRKVKGIIHWVSAVHSLETEVRLYDRLFDVENPSSEKDGRDFTTYLNPNSLETLKHCRVEPSLSTATLGRSYQFERLGYFCVDPIDSSEGSPVFNRTVTLRDTWAKIAKRDKN